MKTILILSIFFLFTIQGRSQWTQKADFAGSANRDMAVGFSIGNKGFIGTGSEIYICGLPVACQKDYKDFWEYNPENNTWTKKADFGGDARIQAVGFSIGDKGYIGTGGRSGYRKDFWEYNPVNDTWTRKADFPGAARWAAVGFAIGNKGYIGTGGNGTQYFRDIWEYDPATDQWTQKADFPGTVRGGAVGFSIGSKGYIGLGWSEGNLENDFWEYDPMNDSWEQVADFPAGGRQGATGFSIGLKGYVVTGNDGSYKNDFWEWDSTTNTWQQKENFGGAGRIKGVGFSIDTKAYFGTGNSSGIYKNDFWEYNAVITANSRFIENTVKIYPNPDIDKITIHSPEKSIIELTDINGHIMETYYQSGSDMAIDMNGYTGGIYFVKVKTKEKVFVQKIIKTDKQ